MNLLPKFEIRGLRKIMRLLLLVLLTVNVYAQSVPIGPRSDVRGIVVDSLNNQLKVFFSDHYNTVDLTTYETKTFKFYYKKDGELAPDTFTTSQKNLIIDGVVYFINDGGGMVYALENDTLKRIDESFDHKMQSGSTLFSYKSKIYKYGGYGFWSARNFFTYYDFNQKEWEVTAPINSAAIPVGMKSCVHLLVNDEIYFFDGSTINPYNRFEYLQNEEVWKFNLQKNEWQYLGKDQYINEDRYNLNSSQNGVYRFKYKNKIVILQQQNIALVDFIENKLTLFDHNYKKGSISQRLIFQAMPFYLNGKFYCFVYDQYNVHSTQNILMEAMDEKDFFGKKISDGVFYKNKIWYGAMAMTGFIFISLMIAFVLFGLDYIKKRNKIRLLDNGLRFRNKFIEFGHNSMAIIRLLLDQKEVSSREILTMVESAEYSAAHNERMKVQKLMDINWKVKTLIASKEDVIKSKMSKNDKRIRVYSISKELFFIKKR